MLSWFPFTDGEIEAQKTEGTCSVSHGEKVAELALNPKTHSFLDFLLWGVGTDMPLAPAGTHFSSTVLFAKMSSCQPYQGLRALDWCPIPISRGLCHQLASVSKPSPSCCPRWDAGPRALCKYNMNSADRVIRRALNQHLDFLLYIHYSNYVSGINVRYKPDVPVTYFSLECLFGASWNRSWC